MISRVCCATSSKPALVELLPIPELGARARFYATPEGAAVMRKLLVFSYAVTLALEAALVGWARAVVARVPRAIVNG